jgi:hypothetical protein
MVHQKKESGQAFSSKYSLPEKEQKLKEPTEMINPKEADS